MRRRSGSARLLRTPWSDSEPKPQYAREGGNREPNGSVGGGRGGSLLVLLRVRGLYEDLVRELRASDLDVATGEFQASMEVELVNDGPVTVLIDSRR